MRILALAGLLLASAAPTVAQAADFEGPHFGVIVGWDDISYENKDLGIDEDWNDTTYGIASGYDFKVGPSFVVGVGASTTLSDNKRSYTDGVETFKIKAKRDIELAVRAGVIVQDAALLYAKIGYANSKVKASSTIGNVTVSDSNSDSGLRVGAGAEVALFGPITGTVEYRYTTYGGGFTRNQIFGGLNYRF